MKENLLNILMGLNKYGITKNDLDKLDFSLATQEENKGQPLTLFSV